MKSKKILSILVLVVALGGGLFAVSQLNVNQEEKLEKRLEEVGEDFYLNFYYGQISANKTEAEVAEFLEKYVETGINVDIDNLSRFDVEKFPNLLDEFVNKKDDIVCHIRNTKAIIYPKSPFGKDDYEISSQLDCGFEE